MNNTMSIKERFMQLFPQSYFLDLDDKAGLNRYLADQKFLMTGEKISMIEKAGEGNMNLVLRATTGSRSFIVKQARPWVEKYPQIEAPENRIWEEAEYYQIVSTDNFLAQYHPAVLHFDAGSFLLILEDLGSASDFTYLYREEASLDEAHLLALTSYLSALHGGYHSVSMKKPVDNFKMRKLNAAHIFELPFAIDNGFDLDSIQPGLSEAAKVYVSDARFRTKAEELMKTYLAEGSALLHGDFYPGSWLETESGLKIIDPEFCFSGPAEFDVGIFLAHLILSQHPQALIVRMLQSYTRAEHFDMRLAFNFAGVEIIRRIIGLAQLPLQLSLEQRKALLRQGGELLTVPEKSTLWIAFNDR